MDKLSREYKRLMQKCRQVFEGANWDEIEDPGLRREFNLILSPPQVPNEFKGVLRMLSIDPELSPEEIRERMPERIGYMKDILDRLARRKASIDERKKRERQLAEQGVDPKVAKLAAFFNRS